MAHSVRKTARAIILTPQHEVLLMRVAFPWLDEDLWILPGGGVEEGEDVRSTIAREVYEETGATDIEIVGEAWRNELVIAATNVHLKQRFFLVRAKHFDAEPTDLSEPEMNWVREYRWWTVNSLMTADIALEPEHIVDGIQNLISHGLPAEPIDIDGLS